MTWNRRAFDGLLEELRKCRFPTKNGKKLAHETYAILRNGTMDEPRTIVVRHYSTDIVTHYRDGSYEVNCAWSSATTCDRIYRFSNCQIIKHKLPTFNRRLPTEEKVTALICWTDPRPVPALGIIRIDPHGKLDMETVQAIGIEVISDLARVRPVIRKLSKAYQQIAIRTRLKAFDQNRRGVSCAQWLCANIDTPLEQLDYGQLSDRAFMEDHNVAGLEFPVAR